MEKRKLIRELQSHQSVLKEKAREKARESISAVIPIVLIVFILGFTVAALSPGILVEFLVGSVLVILGMIFFSMGAELSMTPMGEHVGGSMLRTKKLGFIIIIGFILGFIITISEPDLQVLAEQVSSVPNLVLILSGGTWCWCVSCCGLIAYPFWNCAAAIVIQFLYFSICISHVCS